MNSNKKNDDGGEEDDDVKTHSDKDRKKEIQESSNNNSDKRMETSVADIFKRKTEIKKLNEKIDKNKDLMEKIDKEEIKRTEDKHKEVIKRTEDKHKEEIKRTEDKHKEKRKDNDTKNDTPKKIEKKETDRKKNTDLQTDKNEVEKEKETDTKRQLDSSIHTDKHTCKHLDKHTDKYTDKNTNKRKIHSSPIPSPIKPSNKKRKIILSSDEDEDEKDDGGCNGYSNDYNNKNNKDYNKNTNINNNAKITSSSTSINSSSSISQKDNNNNKGGGDDDDDSFIEGVGESGLCERMMVKGKSRSSQLSSSDNSIPTQEKKHNLGSLKAFSWSRNQEKLNRSVCLSPEVAVDEKKTDKKKLRRIRVCDDDDDDEEEDIRKNALQNEKTHSKKRKKIKNVDDDEDEAYKNHGADDDDSDGDGGEDDYGDGEKKGEILDFLNQSSVDELVCLGGCSRKKADAVMSLRPFRSWKDLLGKLDSTKLMGRWVVEECGEVLRLRGIVRGLMDQCTLISHHLQSSITHMQDNGDKNSKKDKESHKGKHTDKHLDKHKNKLISLSSCRHLKTQPPLLNSNLKLANYQLVGLNWLVMMHQQKLNGILGDEMGLGKTIQTIAFLAYLLQHNYSGPHVIVSPSSTIDNWLRELKLWCPSLSVLPYYGSQEERREMRVGMMKGGCDVDIVLTSYNMAASTAEDRMLFKKVSFNYAIFDEGHMLKNMTTTRYKSLLRISAKRRLLLTGTPLQNNLLELISLLSFIMPDIFAGNTDCLKKIFSSGEKNTTTTTTSSGSSDAQTNNSTDTNTHTYKRGSYEQETLENAKKILQPFFLRRLKIDVLNQLPSKVQRVVRVGMPKSQKVLYEGLVRKYASQLRKNKENNVNNNEGAAVMMNLRKAANHPLLHRVHYSDEVLRYLAKNIIKDKEYRDCSIDCVFEDMQVMSDFELHNLCLKSKYIRDRSLDKEVVCQSAKFNHLDVLLPTLHKQGDRVLLFSQFTMVLDIVEVYLKDRGHRFIRLDGATKVTDRQDLIDDFNNDSEIFIFLLSTKAGGVGINLSSANVVIIHDIDFNPYNDKQAEDRCHRVGQTREVTVYKLLTEHTIEEGMHKCALKKLKLEKDVTCSDNKNKETSDVAMLLKEALNVK